MLSAVSRAVSRTPVVLQQSGVGYLWVAPLHARDLLRLTGRERLVRIETPDPVEQSLPAQHFVNAGNAPGEVVRDVEHGPIRVGECSAMREQRRLELARHARALDGFEHRDCGPCPHRKLSEQSAVDPANDRYPSD